MIKLLLQLTMAFIGAWAWSDICVHFWGSSTPLTLVMCALGGWFMGMGIVALWSRSTND